MDYGLPFMLRILKVTAENKFKALGNYEASLVFIVEGEGRKEEGSSSFFFFCTNTAIYFLFRLLSLVENWKSFPSTLSMTLHV